MRLSHELCEELPHEARVAARLAQLEAPLRRLNCSLERVFVNGPRAALEPRVQRSFEARVLVHIAPPQRLCPLAHERERWDVGAHAAAAAASIASAAGHGALRARAGPWRRRGCGRGRERQENVLTARRAHVALVARGVQLRPRRRCDGAAAQRFMRAAQQ